jgi:hypothetical protein
MKTVSSSMLLLHKMMTLQVNINASVVKTHGTTIIVW